MKAEQQDEPTRADAHPVDCTGLVARLMKLRLKRSMDAEEYSISGTDEQWGNAVQDVAALHRSIQIVERYDRKSDHIGEPNKMVFKDCATVEVSHRENNHES